MIPKALRFKTSIIGILKEGIRVGKGNTQRDND